MYEYLLFDLDGTVTDSAEGITKCVQYALNAQGIDEPDLNKLKPFVGPPLVESFMKYYGLTKEQAVEATKKYRERFEKTGMFENRLYDGVDEALRALKTSGRKLVIASSKPEKYVRIILEHFGVAELFTEIVGASMDETRLSKADVIKEAFGRLGLENEPDLRSRVLMIGDRLHDVEGAASCGLDCLGVYFGFAQPGELEKAGAAYIVNTVDEMKEMLLKL